MNKQSKILIVDDKPENLFALEVTLSEPDIEIIKASSGNEAIKATLDHDFALMVLDVQMPEMDGYELAEILRKRNECENRIKSMALIHEELYRTKNLSEIDFAGYIRSLASRILKS